jgi:hypothetical protein
VRLPDPADHPNVVLAVGWAALIAIFAGGVACALDKF